MKITLSKRLLAAVLIIVLALSAANTILILDQRQALQDAAHDAIYDYVIFQDSDTYKAKNQATGKIDFTSADAATVINQALTEGNTLYLKPGSYALNADIQVNNKINAKIIGDSAIIIGNNQKILVKGDNYALSQNNIIQGLTVINGTLRIENSFATTVTNTAFINCTTALELANTNTWTEGTKVENCRFVNSKESIAFRTPTGNGTGSYASTQISRCYFNIPDNSVGITVEYLAEFSDSQLQDLRMWMGENDAVHNQTPAQRLNASNPNVRNSVRIIHRLPRPTLRDRFRRNRGYAPSAFSRHKLPRQLDSQNLQSLQHMDLRHRRSFQTRKPRHPSGRKRRIRRHPRVSAETRHDLKL